MCDPLTLGGLAASVAGSGANYMMQSRAVDEQNRQNRIAMDRERQAREAEVGRQRQFEGMQAEEAMRALMEAAPETQVERVAEEVVAPENRIVAAQEQYNVPVLQGQVQNQDVNDSMAATVQSAMERTRRMLQAAATLSAQGTGAAGVGDALGRMGSEISTIGSNRRGSLNAASLETSVPVAEVTRSQSPIGDLLMLGGQALAGYGGRQAGIAGGRRPFQLGSIFGGAG